MKWTLNQVAVPALTINRKWRKWRRWIVGIAIFVAIAAGITAWVVRRQASHEIEAARAALERSALIPFDRESLQPLAGRGVTLMQSRRGVRDLVRFDDAWFAATDGGLLELAGDGRLKRAFTVLDGLPESDLLCLAVFQSKLFIGTRSRGLVAFDGKRFERFRWTDRKAQAVTVLAENRGRLLAGTFAGGLIEFDGRQFREINSDAGRIAGIYTIVTDNSRLLIGTFAGGLWMNEAGRWSHFTVADGLPSNRVVGIAADGDRLLVATDFGVAKLAADASGRQRFQTLATMPALAGIVARGNAALLCKDNGELFRLIMDERPDRARLDPVEWRAGAKPPANLSSCQFKAFESKTGQTSDQGPGHALWLLSSEGIWRTDWQDERFAGRLQFAAFGELREAGGLSSNLVSAMAFDDLGRLWAGSFRDGIDIFSPRGPRVAHIESDAVREINALVWDGASKRMLAATAQGLIRFDDGFGVERTSTNDGLLANSVSHVTPVSTKSFAGLALATSRGLSLGEAKRWQALTAVQGLPSNSVYALLPDREFLYAGTLGGLAQIAGGRVVRVFKDSNSKLTTNWVTALCRAGNRLFVGAYGGGVFELTAAGELVSFASETGRVSVNPNAMLSDGEWLYVGTLDGVWALELRTQRWVHLRDELPSQTVLSVAADESCVYFGTTSGIARVDKRRFGSPGE
ncbi:MAG: ligand-binding sensor domain-containing protein [Blastocatellia bacterium]